MTGERRPAGATDPPRPHGLHTVDELVERLGQLRAWSGVSYRTVHREVVRLRAARDVPERPVYNTVYRCFQAGRTRLDVELVVDIAQVLLDDEPAAAAWRQACQVINGRAGAAEVVEVAARLPDDPGGFTGRRAELRQLLDIGMGVAAIDGMAGVGKTRLAIHAAHHLGAELQLIVDLRGYDQERPPADPAAVLDGFLRCLGVSGDQIGQLDLAARTSAFRQHLAGKRAVIVLDNAAAADQILPLLPDSPQCQVLVTSRRALHIAGAGHVSLDVFTTAEALDFLRTAAGRDRIDADLDAATAIVELAANLPLALALIAARINASPEWTLADHVERLDAKKRSLRLEAGVEVAVSLSYHDLPPEARQAFLLLALHPGGDIEAYAAAALVGADLPTAQQHLAQLRAANLLQQRTVDRYVFHDLIRLYAVNRAHDEEAASARRGALTRLLDHYEYGASLAMDLYAPHEKDRRPDISPTPTPVRNLADRYAATEWLEAERHNLIAAARYATDNGLPIHASHQSDILKRYLEMAGHHSDAEVLHGLAVHTTDSAGKLRALNNLGAVYLLLARYEEAVSIFESALTRRPQTRERAVERRVLANLGVGLMQLGRCREALEHFEHARVIARELNDRVGEGSLLNNVGLVYAQLGRYPEALDSHRQAVAISRALGDRHSEGMAMGNMGVIYTLLGQDHEALDHHQRAFAIARELGDRRGIGLGLDNIGIMYARSGRLREAIEHHEQARDIAREIGNSYTECVAIKNLGMAQFRLRQHRIALDHYKQALGMAEGSGLTGVRCEVLNLMAETLLAIGSTDEALEHYRQALELATSFDIAHQRARAHDGLGNAMAAAGDDAAAQSHWHQSLELYRELGVAEAAELRSRLAARVNDQTSAKLAEP